MCRPLAFALILFFFSACSNNSKNSQTGATIDPASGAFNRAADSALAAYYNMAEAFVKWDSMGIVQTAGILDQHIGNLEQEAGTDSSLSKSGLAGIRKQLEGIRGNADIFAKRHALNSLSTGFFSLLKEGRYSAKKLFLQECNMPFNDTGNAVWISAADVVRNPYLGLRHPTYGKGMLECGGNKSVLDFTSKDN
ncbi:MAG TPA: hypothetical protein VFR58_17595 [Flavisolibacter sp.]|nr:hypothetical protein [Flavisolibacter sp.]